MAHMLVSFFLKGSQRLNPPSEPQCGLFLQSWMHNTTLGSNEFPAGLHSSLQFHRQHVSMSPASPQYSYWQSDWLFLCFGGPNRRCTISKQRRTFVLRYGGHPLHFLQVLQVLQGQCGHSPCPVCGPAAGILDRFTMKVC